MTEPHRSIAERCEVLAAELHDEGQRDRAILLWEAEAYIRGLEREAAGLARKMFTPTGGAADLYLGSDHPRWQNDFRYSD